MGGGLDSTAVFPALRVSQLGEVGAQLAEKQSPQLPKTQPGLRAIRAGTLVRAKRAPHKAATLNLPVRICSRDSLLPFL